MGVEFKKELYYNLCSLEKHNIMSQTSILLVTSHLQASVTGLGDFLHFWQPFKASDNHYFTQIAPIVRQFL